MDLDEHFEGEEERPDVEGALFGGVDVGLARAEPAVLVLVGEDVVYVAHDLLFETLIVEQEGEGDDAVEPVGGAFPALLLSAEPAAVFDVGPELVEVSAEAVGLQGELVVQPAAGTHCAQGQGGEDRRSQGVRHG